MRATLTDDDCTYEGDTTARAGRFSIEVENKTDQFTAFLLAELAEGAGFDDVGPFLAKALRQPESDRPLPSLMPPYETMAGAEVEPRTTTFLPLDYGGTRTTSCLRSAYILPRS